MDEPNEFSEFDQPNNAPAFERASRFSATAHKKKWALSGAGAFSFAAISAAILLFDMSIHPKAILIVLIIFGPIGVLIGLMLAWTTVFWRSGKPRDRRENLWLEAALVLIPSIFILSTVSMVCLSILSGHGLLLIVACVGAAVGAVLGWIVSGTRSQIAPAPDDD